MKFSGPQEIFSLHVKAASTTAHALFDDAIMAQKFQPQRTRRSFLLSGQSPRAYEPTEIYQRF
jgi:hypothetical protein